MMEYPFLQSFHRKTCRISGSGNRHGIRGRIEAGRFYESEWICWKILHFEDRPGGTDRLPCESLSDRLPDRSGWKPAVLSPRHACHQTDLSSSCSALCVQGEKSDQSRFLHVKHIQDACIGLFPDKTSLPGFHPPVFSNSFLRLQYRRSRDR